VNTISIKERVDRRCFYFYETFHWLENEAGNSDFVGNYLCVSTQHWCRWVYIL